MKLGQSQQETHNENKEIIKKATVKIAAYGSEDRITSNFVDVLDDTGNYIPIDSNEGIQELTDKASIILTIITNIGMIIAVLMCAILGLKYMLGSLEEKAEYKKDMIPYFIGACLLFGISAIVNVLQQIGQSINNI